MQRIIVRKDSYFDSVFLMLASSELKQRDGVEEAIVAMGTELNRDLLADMDLTSDAIAGAGPNDLIIAIRATDEATADAAAAQVDTILSRRADSGDGERYRPGSLASALDRDPDADLVVISVPGAFAAREARRALKAGRHVMIFSDNVSEEQEVELKRLARERGLLVMGPDCGTAIINGKPLCFANVVPRGPVGVVSASGTGLQEVTSLLARFGSGVSQAIGTGGRDLKSEAVGGTTTLMAIEALAADPNTTVIAVISKPPHPAVAETVMTALAAAGKPAVVHLIGSKAETGAGVTAAASLEDTARIAAALAAGTRPASGAGASVVEPSDIESLAEREVARIAPSQRFLRGYFTGGTLTDEAVFLLNDALGGIHSFDPADPAFKLADPQVSQGHTIVDLGEDVFTVGRPHPMIDPSTRTERMEREAGDESIACVLLDCVIGYGSAPDPAGALAPAIRAMREAAEKRGACLPVVASVTGTEGDPQSLSAQRRTLEDAGAVVMQSNYQAARLALAIMQRVVARGEAR